MNSDVYEQLARALDLLPLGFPRTQSGVELQILRKIFLPDEALVASNMTGTSETVESIAERANLPKEETEQRLEAMLGRRIIWSSVKSGLPKFRLAPYVVGFYEEQLETMDHELAHLCERYWMEGGGEGIMRYEPNTNRVAPAHRAFKTEVILPYDDVRELMLQAKSFQLRDCICRKQQDLIGARKCDFPIRNCLSFFAAELPVEPNTITQKEALELLDQAEEIGMVHTVANQANGFFWLCNCCGCCCAMLRGINELGIQHSVARANYYAVVDPQECKSCGTCEDRCQVNAVSVDDVATIDVAKCIGCGVCVSGCPNEALSLNLVPDAEIITPPENYKAWEQERLRNRGLRPDPSSRRGRPQQAVVD